MSARVLTSVRRPFRAMAEAFVPEAVGLDEKQWSRAEAVVERSLAPRPAEMKRQLRLFVRAVNWMAVARFARPLTAVEPERRVPFLRALEKAPLLPVRRGVWGVRTLAFMAVYSLPEVREEIGYRAAAGGWEEAG